MRNGTNTRASLAWIRILTLALLVALFCVGCAVLDEGSDANPVVTEPSEGGEVNAEAEAVVAETHEDDADADTKAAANADAAVNEASEAEAENVEDQEMSASPAATSDDLALPESGTYTSKDEVAWYLHTYGHLPSNYITKREAQDCGWKTSGLSLREACPGKSIGGDRFGNYEGLLPEENGRIWYECDIDYKGEKSRNGKRIVYSNDGLIYYTADHYGSFERIY